MNIMDGSIINFSSKLSMAFPVIISNSFFLHIFWQFFSNIFMTSSLFSIKYDFSIPLEMASKPTDPDPAKISIIDLFLYISIECLIA